MSISKPFQSRNASDIEYVSFNDAFETGSPVDKRKAEKLLANFMVDCIMILFLFPVNKKVLIIG